MIIDKYTDLPISRQRKWLLRHPNYLRLNHKRNVRKYYYRLHDPLKKLVKSNDEILRIYEIHLQKLRIKKLKIQKEIDFFENQRSFAT